MFQLFGVLLQKLLYILAPHTLPLRSSPSQISDRLPPWHKFSESLPSKTYFSAFRLYFSFFFQLTQLRNSQMERMQKARCVGRGWSFCAPSRISVPDPPRVHQPESPSFEGFWPGTTLVARAHTAGCAWGTARARSLSPECLRLRCAWARSHSQADSEGEQAGSLHTRRGCSGA